ncbi:nicotinamide mononucleotide transporter PnuC [Klebsiella pneumoniae]|uniref:Nicotinamide riboside transporter PnuC n=1 Tax=Klebsiella pneumoniae TaxID=573 RepID=A0A377W8Z0_KLEPN|nr:nicotinamide mononucleotide transporter PnuC [Klebsiella pneumoniae]
MDFFSTQNILVHIPIGAGGYDLSWIEAVGTIAGLLCIWLASLEKISNYAFGLVNVTLFAIIFFQIQLYASLLLQLFFFAANVYGWYAWSRQSSNHEAELQIRWLPRSKALGWLAACVVAIGLLTLFINPFFAFLTRDRGQPDASARFAGHYAGTAAGCFPVLGLLYDGAVGGGDDLNDPQVC